MGESVLGDDGLREEVEGAGVFELEGEGAEEVLEDKGVALVEVELVRL